ncbi:hypothetical protein J3459_017126 [Metarhizium acridum]|uniref:Uncharacterized protein n=1 Tax=Metarhizium acridum (strain CQMa 102) TaxID=655827 RepID=E9DZ02_METAQ|nr:uncharacterized protein MAC_02850 [Metarhizium acridum CQMa 102]EFY91179.1 hypothetical protein MAC_02850 [Metarhizium acridum CQMa 102]KAG8410448.1 hypothetical protein J3459_017126 [Metarhizium acridum]KAG8410740.1 hypothetical protein J3458_016840 [Metarhizium acridum]
MLAPSSQQSGLQGNVECNKLGADSLLDNGPGSRAQDQQEANRETEQGVGQGAPREIKRKIARIVARVFAREIPRDTTQEVTQEVTPREIIPQEDAPQEDAPQQVAQDIQQPVNQPANQQIQLIRATMTRESRWLQLTFPVGSDRLVDEFCTEVNRNLSIMRTTIASSAYIPDPGPGCRVMLPVHGLVRVTPPPTPTLYFGSQRAAKRFKKHTFVFEHPSEDEESQKALYMPDMSIGVFREKLSSKGSRVWSWWPNPNSHLRSRPFRL